MRDPKRIKKILAEIEKYWTKYPDLRLGQMMSNFWSEFENTESDIFFLEDDKLLKVLKKLNR